MMNIIGTNSDNKDFFSLVKLLDADLAERDGADHPFYAQYNMIDKIKYVVVAYENEKPVSCGAIKEFEDEVFDDIKKDYPQQKDGKVLFPFKGLFFIAKK